jgi:predicted nucleotidyltransferase
MRFSSQELDVARQSLLDRVIKYFLNREGVEALYIQGSVASGLTDEFSDIDFRVVIQPEMYEQYTSERFSVPKHWGEWLYNEWTSNVWVCVSHFKPFNKIDVLYFKPEHLQPSLWYLLPTQVIYDPKNLVQQIIEASQKIEFILDVGELDRLIS